MFDGRVLKPTNRQHLPNERNKTLIIKSIRVQSRFKT